MMFKKRRTRINIHIKETEESLQRLRESIERIKASAANSQSALNQLTQQAEELGLYEDTYILKQDVL